MNPSLTHVPFSEAVILDFSSQSSQSCPLLHLETFGLVSFWLTVQCVLCLRLSSLILTTAFASIDDWSCCWKVDWSCKCITSQFSHQFSDWGWLKHTDKQTRTRVHGWAQASHYYCYTHYYCRCLETQRGLSWTSSNFDLKLFSTLILIGKLFSYICSLRMKHVRIMELLIIHRPINGF